MSWSQVASKGLGERVGSQMAPEAPLVRTPPLTFSMNLARQFEDHAHETETDRHGCCHRPGGGVGHAVPLTAASRRSPSRCQAPGPACDMGLAANRCHAASLSPSASVT